MIDVDRFKSEGYIILQNRIPKDILDFTAKTILGIKKDIIENNKLGRSKEKGSPEYWRGIDMASTMCEELYKIYTIPFMYDIAKHLLESDDVFLFNDQIVVKLPNEEFEFTIHSDNQLGPNPALAEEGKFKTITCAWILDDFTDENGPIEILNKESRKWIKPLPRSGDIMIWCGNTIHKSSVNVSKNPRRVYLMVYANKDITLLDSSGNFSKRYYGDKFPI